MTSEDSSARVVIRAYQPRDRQAVRDVSYETADGGEPGVTIHRDRAFVADMLTRYYTDWEPGSLWVADADGAAVGYAAGCLDTRRQLAATMKSVLPRAVLAAALRGALFRADTWRLARNALRTYMSGGSERGVDLEAYPAHVHVDILKGYRGRHTGAALMERFLAQAAAAGVAGVHLSVREDNAPARRFFEKNGFVEIGRQPTLLVPRGARGTLYSVVYGKKLK